MSRCLPDSSVQLDIVLLHAALNQWDIGWWSSLCSSSQQDSRIHECHLDSTCPQDRGVVRLSREGSGSQPHTLILHFEPRVSRSSLLSSQAARLD